MRKRRTSPITISPFPRLEFLLGQKCDFFLQIFRICCKKMTKISKYISRINFPCNNYPPKAKFPGNEIPKFQYVSMHDHFLITLKRNSCKYIVMGSVHVVRTMSLFQLRVKTHLCAMQSNVWIKLTRMDRFVSIISRKSQVKAETD